VAIDTRDKRFSMMGLLQPVPSVLPNPNGAISQQDRSMLLFLYHGIVAALPPTPLTFGVLSFMDWKGQGVIDTISQSGIGVIDKISQSMGVLSIIDNKGKGVKATISQTGIGVEDKL
jgi:hypothetical protein